MRVFLALLVVFWVSTTGMSQLPMTTVDSRKANFVEFEGQYKYRDGLTLFMVTIGDRLMAVIDDSKYLLRATGVDTFLNPAGDSIPFIRDADGHIVAFKENGEKFLRMSPSVPAATRTLLQPRNSGPNGVPVAYRYQLPSLLADGLRIGKAGSGTLPTEVAEQIVNGVIDGTYADVRSILVYHKAALVLEEYFYGFNRDRPHEMRSFTKSVISLLVGAAIDRALLRANEPVLERLGYSAFSNPDPRKAKVTLTHLLSNQSGMACNEHDRRSPGNEMNLFETSDWVKAFVDLPMVADPGTASLYCSGGFYTAGRIVERVTRKPLPEFADEVLFKPLGIGRNDWKWNFKLNRSHRNDFGQLFLRPRDMLKMGILIQNRGAWQGRRVISTSWIDVVVSRQSRIEDSDYGLGIWHRWYSVRTPEGDRRVDTIMLSGNGGQKVYLVPSLDLIVVSTGSAFFVESPMNEIMASVLLPEIMRTFRTN